MQKLGRETPIDFSSIRSHQKGHNDFLESNKVSARTSEALTHTFAPLLARLSQALNNANANVA